VNLLDYGLQEWLGTLMMMSERHHVMTAGMTRDSDSKGTGQPDKIPVDSDEKTFYLFYV
jgi:hypothetical protein